MCARFRLFPQFYVMWRPKGFSPVPVYFYNGVIGQVATSFGIATPLTPTFPYGLDVESDRI